MKEEVIKIQLLPSTAETENGPVIYRSFDKVIVYYDHDYTDNYASYSNWAKVFFHNGLAFKWTPDSACTGQMIDAYSAVAVVENSLWLTDMRGDAEDNHMSLAESNRHYMIYFDHFGCLEVLAGDFVFTDEVEPPTFHLAE